jgi:hypothetical protein
VLTPRENYIRNVRRAGPEWIPVNVNLLDAMWREYSEELAQVVSRHPTIFPDYRPRRSRDGWRSRRQAGTTERDPWGVLWEFDYEGIEGQAVEHPLANWAAFDDFVPPDPMTHSDRGGYDWPAWHDDIRTKKAAGELTLGGLPHGYFLMRLWYLRGFENLMMDIATDEPRLQRLADMLVERNNVIVSEFIRAGVDCIHFGEDLGTQTASILSPKHFRRWVVPAYKRMMGPVKQAGIIVDTHSDGYIMELVDDLLECGCDVLNPQDLCNGIDEIARAMKGRCCIKCDVDRQKIVPFGTRREIHELIEEEVRKLGSPEGGLSFVVGVVPPTPPENVDALCCAFEKFRTCWWD